MYPKGVKVDKDVVSTNADEHDNGDDVEKGEELHRQEHHINRVSRNQIEKDEASSS